MKDKKAVIFWKKNAYYIIIAICAVAIVVMSTFAIKSLTDKQGGGNQILNPDDGNNKDPDEGNNENPGGETPVNTEIIFAMPVSNVNIIRESTTDAMPVSLDPTTGYYKSHIAIDFGGSAGDSVFAVYGGTIVSNTTDELDGTIIVIDHGKGLKTIYKSLTNASSLKAGDTVKKGDKIGEMSTSFRPEEVQGAHLHFEVSENGVLVNPEKYLVFEEK